MELFLAQENKSKVSEQMYKFILYFKPTYSDAKENVLLLLRKIYFMLSSTYLTSMSGELKPWRKSKIPSSKRNKSSL